MKRTLILLSICFSLCIILGSCQSEKDVEGTENSGGKYDPRKGEGPGSEGYIDRDDISFDSPDDEELTDKGGTEFDAEEEARKKAEEEARQKAEEEARKQAKEEARQKAEEEARKKSEEEERKKREAEVKALNSTLKVNPDKAYFNEQVTFLIETPEYDKWEWTWDFGDGTPTVKNKQAVAHKYPQLGKKTMKLKAKHKITNKEVFLTREVLVTVSKKFLDDRFKELKACAKNLDQSENSSTIKAFEDKEKEILKLVTPNARFKVPGDKNYLNWEGFIDILLADIGIPGARVYSSITGEPVPDSNSGQIKTIVFK